MIATGDGRRVREGVARQEGDARRVRLRRDRDEGRRLGRRRRAALDHDLAQHDGRPASRCRRSSSRSRRRRSRARRSCASRRSAASASTSGRCTSRSSRSAPTVDLGSSRDGAPPGAKELIPSLLYARDLGFRPPSGLGIRVESDLVSGGGFLFFDRDKEEYAGVLQLDFGRLALTAIGLLTTQLPDGGRGLLVPDHLLARARPAAAARAALALGDRRALRPPPRARHERAPRRPAQPHARRRSSSRRTRSRTPAGCSPRCGRSSRRRATSTWPGRCCASAGAGRRSSPPSSRSSSSGARARARR